MKVAFRVDASLIIGTGHLMRCLALAGALRQEGAACRFLVADLPGHMADAVRAAGFEVALLPAPRSDAVDPDDYTTWNGNTVAEDAHLMRASMGAPDWVVVDHYGLDAVWEAELAGSGARVLAIDDLANRMHAAEVLVDPNLGRAPEDYRGLVPADAIQLTGPRYAMLRPEFAALRDEALARRAGRRLAHLLVTMGGVDRNDATSDVLRAVADAGVPEGLHATVVLGATAPHFDAVRELSAGLPFPVRVESGVQDMARLMAEADLAVGGVGGTAWERAVLGLPTLMLSIAENQRPAAQAMDKAGAAIWLGRHGYAGWSERLGEALVRMADPAELAALSARTAAICDGHGAGRVAAAMRGEEDW